MTSLLLVTFHLLLPIKKYDHAIYISVMEIDDQQMKIKVFTDNLEDALRANSNSIEGYFRKKIKLQINEEILSFRLVEITEKGDSNWITFGFDAPQNWHSFYLEANYLMELFPDQTNVIKVMGKKPQFFKLTKFNSSCSFTL